jgi:hypothetical protein
LKHLRLDEHQRNLAGLFMPNSLPASVNMQKQNFQAMVHRKIHGVILNGNDDDLRAAGPETWGLPAAAVEIKTGRPSSLPFMFCSS